jgi:hypothetical protein
MSDNSFTNKKELRFVFTLAIPGTTIIIDGLRAIVEIEKGGGNQMGTLHTQIYGVSQSDMNSITTLTYDPVNITKNTIQVFAIDGDQETMVFQGDIRQAWGDYRSMPDVFLMVEAFTNVINKLTPATPTSYKGSVSVVNAMNDLANAMGLTFENNGVSTQMAKVALSGTLHDQAMSLAQAAGIDIYIDDKILAICPRNMPRQFNTMALISPTTGLIGYPTFDAFGVVLKTLFNPAIMFGGHIQVVSSLPRACGKFFVSSIDHWLESEKPGGRWESTVIGTKNDDGSST